MQVWNLEAKNAIDITGDSVVRPTSYMEIHNLLGTSGCSKEWPYWNWSSMGVIETPKGNLAVSPGDRLMRINEDYTVPLPPFLRLPRVIKDVIAMPVQKFTRKTIKSAFLKLPGIMLTNGDMGHVLVMHHKHKDKQKSLTDLRIVDDELFCADEVYWTNHPDYEDIILLGILDHKIKSREGIPQHYELIRIR